VAGHGTNVAGVVAAEGNNLTNLAGVSWRNKLMALRIGGNAPVSDLVVDAINYINALRSISGINVRVANISASIGNSTGLSSAIESARLNGIIVVTSAGNNGNGLQLQGWNNDAPGQAIYPSSLTHNNIISVAASNTSDVLASFSNWGPTSVDLAAPGDSLPVLLNGGGTGTNSGTSFAAPMVAGAVALLFAIKPDATYTQVRDAILNNVESVPALSGFVATGGRLDLFAAAQSIYTGAAKTFIGDASTGPTADDVLIRPKPGTPTITQIMRFDGSTYQLFAETNNQVSKRIDVYTLGGNDAVTVATGVNNKIYAGGSEGNDTFDASANASQVTLIGEAGNDVLKGGSAGDSLEGGAGNDTLYGNAGNDFLNGVGGDDWIYARNGTVGSTDPDSVYGGTGNDRGQRNTTESVWSGIEILL